MAKKDEQDTDGYKFEVPDFDEDAFIHKEMVSFRTTSVLFVWGILAAAISWGVYLATDGAGAWYLGLAIMAAFLYLLKFVFARLNVDISHFGRKEWFGTGFLFFFTWLAFFMVLLNPPITDHASPHIEAIISPPIQQVEGDIAFDIWFEDNHKVSEATFDLRHGDGSLVASLDDFADMGGGHYHYTLTAAQATTYTYTATAVDPKGHNSTLRGDVPVSALALGITPRSGDLVPGQNLVVTLRGDADPLNVYLEKTDGTRIYLAYSELDAAYVATHAMPGWTDGANTFTVTAEFDNGFYGPELVPAAKVTRGPFTLNLTEPTGNAPAVEPQLPTTVPPNVQRTPGVGIVAAVAVLGGLAIARRRE